MVEGDASVTLKGKKTKVHNNCIGTEWSDNGDTDDYGLEINGYAATIQLVFPLTKDIASFNNKGGGNAGPDSVRDNIKNISQAEAASKERVRDQARERWALWERRHLERGRAAELGGV
jgi:hypothetical protein